MRPLFTQLLLLVGTFIVVTAIASLAGAKNLGTALTFGQVAFAIVLVTLLLRGGPSERPAQHDADADASDE